MTEPSAYQRHLADLIARGTALAEPLVEHTQRALGASGSDQALAHDRQSLFQVAQVVQRHRGAWTERLAHCLATELQVCLQPLPPATPQAPPGTPISLDELTLVDEAQAELTIEIARTVQLIELTAEWELRQWQALAMALAGHTRLGEVPVPGLAVAVARALSGAMSALPLPPTQHHLLLRVAGCELARLVQDWLAHTAQALRQQGHRPLPYRAPPAARQVPASDVNVTEPGALRPVLARVPVTDLVERLCTHLANDDALPPGLQSLLHSLQPALVKLATHDPLLLHGDQHPAWRLVNELVSQGCGYANTDPAALKAMTAYMQPRLAALAQQTKPDRLAFEQALRDADHFITRHGQRDITHSQPALDALAIADRRLALCPLLRQQVEQQLKGVRISTRVAQFLMGPWVDVITHAMAHDREDGEQALAMLSTVDDLLQSLSRPRTLAEREALRQLLPDLIPRLQHGMRLIALPEAACQALLDELMATHSRYLRATPRAVTGQRELSPEELVQRMREEMSAESQVSSILSQTAADRPVDTDVGNLSTVPMRYDGEALGPGAPLAPAQAQAWLDALTTGQWCKLCLGGQWATVHLLWISPERRFFMFSGQSAPRLHPMDCLALQRLRMAGLATHLQERSAMQKAVDSVLQDLGD